MPPRSAVLAERDATAKPSAPAPAGTGRKAVGFFLCFAICYGLLIAPWPGFTNIYRRCFEAVGNAVFARDDSPRYVRFEDSPDPRFAIGIQITLGNRSTADAQGHCPAKALGLEGRGVGWIPTALIIALLLASPVPWRRKAGALPVGILLVQLFVLLSVSVYIWNESTDLGLVCLSPFWKTITDGLEETLIAQLGVSFVVPILLWLALAFRLSDWKNLTALISTPAKPCP